MSLKLLIVEDEAAILSALEQFFGSQGYEVDGVGEQAAAEALLASRRYDAVLADLRLGGSDSTEGLDIVSFVRQRCPETKVLVLTAYGSPEIEQEAWRRGVHAFLHKPLPLAVIAAEVRTLVTGS
jgi:two-component system response regulator HydG